MPEKEYYISPNVEFLNLQQKSVYEIKMNKDFRVIYVMPFVICIKATEKGIQNLKNDFANVFTITEGDNDKTIDFT